MRFLPLVLLSFISVGCGPGHKVTIDTMPPGGTLTVDGISRGPGPISQEFQFKSAVESHQIIASKPGFKDTLFDLTAADDRTTIVIDLEPQSRMVTFNVKSVAGITSVPAIVSVDGKPLSQYPVSQISKKLQFRLDVQQRWTSHTVSAERKGYQTATAKVEWNDKQNSYDLILRPMQKDFRVTTDPPGARIFVDDREVGMSPVDVKDIDFPADPSTGEIRARRVSVQKAGFPETGDLIIRLDDGKDAYHVDLKAHSKLVRILTDPPGAIVRIDKLDVPPDATGVATIRLQFPPLDEKGTLKSYTAVAVKKTRDSEWEPASINIGWDDRKTDYQLTLKEILTRRVPLIRWRLARDEKTKSWHVQPERLDTIAMRDLTEGPGRESPLRVTQTLPPGTVIDTLAMAPDGSRLVFNTLGGGTDAAPFKSRLQLVGIDGQDGPVLTTDKDEIAITPAFTPDGTQVVYSSGTLAGPIGLNAISVKGDDRPGPITPPSNGLDLWPTVDSDPRPRLFFSSLQAGNAGASLCRTPMNGAVRKTLFEGGALEPRVSPTADSVLFVATDPKTGKHDIYQITDQGGPPLNLTNTPDIDEVDPAWSADGSKVAFASDRGEDEFHKRNYDLWVMDMRNAGQLVRITHNGSLDDCPSWDPTGDHIYFRSNRGGEWNIWRIEVK